MTISVKVAALEKMRYNRIAEINNVPLSEWVASILSTYQMIKSQARENCI